MARGTRFGASPARIGCDVCVSHLSFRFSSTCTLECRVSPTVRFEESVVGDMSFRDQCCVPRCSNRGMASPSLLSHSFQWSSELGERFFTCHSSGWLIELPRPQQHGRMHGKHILPEKKCSLLFSCLRACGLFHRPVLWNRERLDTSRKQVQSHRCFLFARMSPKWEYEARRVIERKRDVCPRRRLWEFGPNDDATHFWKLAESKGKRLQRRRSLCQEAFFFFRLHLEERRGLYTQCVCQVTIERYLAFRKLGFLERQLTVSSFSSQVLFQTSDAQTWVSIIQIQTRTIALVTEKPEKPEIHGVYCGR